MLAVEYHVLGMCLHEYPRYTRARYLSLRQRSLLRIINTVIQAASMFLLDEMKFLRSDEICQFRHITLRLYDYKIVLGRLIRVPVLLLRVVSSVNWRIP